MLLGAGCAGTTTTTNTTEVVPPPAAEPTAEVKGRAVFSVKNSEEALKDVTSVKLTVDQVEAHSTTTGWVTISTTGKIYDLVQLKNSGSVQLLADAKLDPGTYDQLRLSISQVEVTADGETRSATLPSNSLKIIGDFTVTADQTSVAALDFKLGKSLRLTGNGKYILAPVVNLQTKEDADVEVNDDEDVDVKGGEIETEKEVGMDEKGETKAGFELPEKVEINAEGEIEIEKD